MNDTSEIIRIFTVGGTIDKIYFDAKSSYEVGPPNIGEILGGLKLNPRFEVTPLMQKDSLDMDDLDRARVKEAVSDTGDRRIIITHGTDTMPETAAALRGIENKTVVLTGALTPARFRTTDAVFNIGMAVGAVQTARPGVYIAMSGQVFEAGQVRKNREANRFESTLD